jgi:steroid delta-isomerase-like uncharacterized protein
VRFEKKTVRPFVRRFERRSMKWNALLAEAIMSTQSNKELVARHFAAFNAGDISEFADTLAEDAVNHAAIPQAQGREGARSIVTKLRAAFPDMRMSVDDVIAEGDKVVCRVTVTGTNQGPLDFAKLKLPATNKSFRATHIHVFRIANGKIAERWAERDDVAMMQQLGILPTLLDARSQKAVQQ